jgi:hypothetical protein
MSLEALMVPVVLLIILAPVFAALAMGWLELRTHRMRQK